MLFGRTAGHRPPTLIIQDELHLLTGPLGTTVGLYEAAINLLCEVDGRPPKVISSTATIRRASAQIMGLFGRPVDLFPPSGIDADDSYFARVDEKTPGRLYVGMMAQGHTSDTAVVHTGTALLQAPVDLGLTGDAQGRLLDGGRLPQLTPRARPYRDHRARRHQCPAGQPGRRPAPPRVRRRGAVVIRAARPAAPTARAPQPAGAPSGSVIDFLASTNMLSVGVDVPRLGLMLVNGQPKATAEYIQATSRVGRSTAPGLVFGLFRSTKPRDRSHYENFRAYHSALYRHVEPTSVTPFSPPVPGPSAARRARHPGAASTRHAVGRQRRRSPGPPVRGRRPWPRSWSTWSNASSHARSREPSSTSTTSSRTGSSALERADEESKLLYYKPNGKGQINLIRQFNTKGDRLADARVDAQRRSGVARRGRAQRRRGRQGGLMQRKIRQSQTIVPFGVGAIFDLQGESLVACDTFRWGPRGERSRASGLAAVLGVTQFRAAPAVDSNAWAAPSAGVPYARFPAGCSARSADA